MSRKPPHHPSLLALPSYFIPAGLFCAALITRFWQLSTPNTTVFDETYFRVFTADYLSHNFFFDIHPPLGKLILAGWAAVLNYQPAALQTAPSTGMRVLPALAGAAIIPVFYALLRYLRVRRLWAATGAIMLLLDGALLVQSRFILLDSMLVLFGLGGLAAFAASRGKSPKLSWLLLAAAGVLIGMACSIKWTGVAMLGIVTIFHISDYFRRRIDFGFSSVLLSIVSLIILPAAVYILSFAIHFALLTHSGTGDAFMSTKYQATLIGGPYYNSQTHISFMDKFIEVNKTMYQSNLTLTATHPYQSSWDTWPLMRRPIAYWFGDVQSDGRTGRIYLFGNPLVWWGSSAAVALFPWILAMGLKLAPRLKFGLIVLAAGYAANYLPFARITRPMFLYHYLFALTMAVGLAMVLLDAITTKSRDRVWIALVIIGLTAISFLFFSPLLYGTPLNDAELHSRMWLTSWE